MPSRSVQTEVSRSHSGLFRLHKLPARMGKQDSETKPNLFSTPYDARTRHFERPRVSVEPYASQRLGTASLCHSFPWHCWQINIHKHSLWRNQSEEAEGTAQPTNTASVWCILYLHVKGLGVGAGRGTGTNPENVTMFLGKLRAWTQTQQFWPDPSQVEACRGSMCPQGPRTTP